MGDLMCALEAEILLAAVSSRTIILRKVYFHFSRVFQDRVESTTRPSSLGHEPDCMVLN